LSAPVVNDGLRIGQRGGRGHAVRRRQGDTLRMHADGRGRLDGTRGTSGLCVLGRDPPADD
jgi:hypothetical protein